MKILELRADNFKRLRVVEIRPQSPLVQISGKNGSGKTSVLDAITAALAGAKGLPSAPIRKGEEKASIVLDLGELRVTRRFTKDSSTVVVEAKDGARYTSPQAVLDALLDRISFDPMSFIGKAPAEQYDELRNLMKLDFRLLDATNKVDYDRRTQLNREALAERSRAVAIVVPPGTPEELIDAAQLVASLEAAGQANAELEKRRANRLRATERITELYQARDARLRRAEENREKIKVLQAEADQHVIFAVEDEKQATELQKKLVDAGDLPSHLATEPIKAAIAEAQLLNQGVRAREMKQQLEAKATTLETEAAQLTEAMSIRTAAKELKLREAKLPVEGLTLGQGELLYQGVPLAQASDADKLRVSVALVMSGSPKLKVIRVRQGNDLDADSLKLLEELVKEKDWQVWLERIEPGPNGIVLEDGSVV